MKRALCCLSMVVCLLIVTDACGQDRSQQNVISLAQSKESAPASTFKPIREQGWDEIIAAAKKEGTVLIYFAPNPTIQKNLADAFKQKYGIALEFITGRGAALSEKIFSERRAGLYLGDLIIQGYTAQFIFKPQNVLQPLDNLLVLPEVTNANNWADNRFPFLDRRPHHSHLY